MAYYHICPRCGSHLDPGEKCDCKQEKQERFIEINFIIDDRGKIIWQKDPSQKLFKGGDSFETL